MGVDKEATDIWKFGRPRPDLTFDETLAAPRPDLTVNEMNDRQNMIAASEARRRSEMIRLLNQTISELPPGHPARVCNPFLVENIRLPTGS